MLEPQQEAMFAKRWREHDDRDAASPCHQPSPASPRSPWAIAATATDPEVVSEGNVGLMQAVKRERKGFRLATYAMVDQASIQGFCVRGRS